MIDMKPLYISSAILALVLAFCLINANAVENRVTEIESYIYTAQACAAAEDWSGAETAVENAHDLWQRQQTYFHIVMKHEELDAAEALFARLDVLLNTRDESDFRADAADLVTQMKLLSELEEISIKNIL